MKERHLESTRWPDVVDEDDEAGVLPPCSALPQPATSTRCSTSRPSMPTTLNFDNLPTASPM